MINKKIVLFVYSQFGFDTLKHLFEKGYNISAVFTHADSQSEHIWFPSVLKYATAQSIPVLTPEKSELIQYVQTLKKNNPEIILSVYYRYLIPLSILSIPAHGAYNIHGSLLPHFRGKAPVNWAILKGATETGLTLHEMVEKPDAGGIVDQRKCTIDLFDTAGSIVEKMQPMVTAILDENIDALLNGTAKKTPLNIQAGSYFSGRTEKDGEIKPDTMNNFDAHNLVRALQPSPQYPAAFLISKDNFQSKIFIYKTTPFEQPDPQNLVADEHINHLYYDNKQTPWLLCKSNTWLKIMECQQE
jgi:methionyl-tRNA formyltransferase